jgi:MFS transporter, DHA1 family, multidrug resistance protein
LHIKNKILFLCFFAAIFSPSGIDLYIALIPTISELYNANSEFALSSYILGMSIGTIFSGFLYDKYGGRKLLLSASLFLLATCIALSYVENFNNLVLLRLLQGISVSPFMLSALSIIKDNMKNEEVGPTYGKINGFMNLIPMLFPILSVAILSYTGKWQSVFTFFSFLTLAFIAFTFLSFKSQNIHWKKERDIPLNQVFKNSSFIKFSLFPILSLSLIFMYCAFSPTVITESLKWDITSYTLYFGFNGILMFFSGQFLGRLFIKYSGEGVLKIGLFFALLSSLLILMSLLYSYLILAGLSLYAISFIMIISSSHSLALSELNSGIGKANGVISAAQMLLGAILSGLSGVLSNSLTIMVFSFIIALMSIFGIKIIKGK